MGNIIVASDNNMISDHDFDALARANRLLVQNWNVLSKMRANGGLGDVSRLIEAEMAYFQSLQLVWDTAAHCINAEHESRQKGE